MLEVLDMAPPPPSRHPKAAGHGHPHHPGRKQPLQSSVAQPKAETAVVPPEGGGKRCGGGGGGRRRGGRGRAKAATEPRPAPPARTVIGPPVPSKGLTFCRRPGFGTVGARCVVKANHFLAELPDKDLTQYDVSPPRSHRIPLPSERNSDQKVRRPFVFFCRSRSRRR
jgi:eukaryotic translation initiation factor 2C